MKTGIFAFGGYCGAVRYYVALNPWSCLVKKQARQAVVTLLLMCRAVEWYLNMERYLGVTRNTEIVRVSAHEMRDTVRSA